MDPRCTRLQAITPIAFNLIRPYNTPRPSAHRDKAHQMHVKILVYSTLSPLTSGMSSFGINFVILPIPTVLPDPVSLHRAATQRQRSKLTLVSERESTEHLVVLESFDADRSGSLKQTADQHSLLGKLRRLLGLSLCLLVVVVQQRLKVSMGAEMGTMGREARSQAHKPKLTTRVTSSDTVWACKTAW
jgi:hypothetical protein